MVGLYSACLNLLAMVEKGESILGFVASISSDEPALF